MADNGLGRDFRLDGLFRASMGHSAFQYYFAALELGLFRLLHERPLLSQREIVSNLGLQPRAGRCLLVGLTSLKLLEQRDDKYVNDPAISELLVQGKHELLLKMARFQAHIVYPGQQDFLQSVISNTNVGLRRFPGNGDTLYVRLQESTALQTVFYDYMSAWSSETIPLVVRNVEFAERTYVADVGGGDGTNAIALANAHPDLTAVILDIPSVCALAEEKVRAESLSQRISVQCHDAFRDPFPSGPNVYLFCHYLVIWSPEQNRYLLKKAFDALPPGGNLIIFSSMASDDGTGPLFSALDCAYFLAIPSSGGQIYSWGEYENWLEGAGFRHIQRIPCSSWTPHGIIIGRKE